MHPEKHALNYRPDIDGLRAIAVIAVVGFHSFPGWVRGGFIGVDVFFVISGFLISRIIFENLSLNRFEFMDFYARRVRRIFPALIVVLAFCLAYGWIAMLPIEYAKLGKHVVGGAAFVSNFILWSESGYFDVVAEQKPLLHLWSLGIEEQFYIFWPLLLGFVWKRKKSFLLVTAIVLFASFLTNILSVTSSPVSAFYSPATRVWELMIGGILAYVVVHSPSNKFSLYTKNIESVLGILCIFAGIVLLRKTSVFPGWWALLPTFGAFFLIQAGPSTWVNRHILGSKVLVSVGLISYPLYLWHWPALYIANQFALDSPTHVRFFRATAIGISLILAYLTFRYIEKPIRNRATNTIALLLVGAMLALALVGSFVFMSDGISSRFPTYMRKAGETPIQAEWREHECFLHPGDEFNKNCTESRKPLLFLWGDSHAAALYPGFKKAGEDFGFAVGQYTVSACAPLVGWESPRGKYCAAYNKGILHTINEQKPEALVLHANWDSATNIGYDLKQLKTTVEKVRASGVKRVFLLGPAPQWNRELPTVLWKCYGKENSPEFSKCELNKSIPEIDSKMEEFARELGVDYISLFKEMCSDAGCLVRIGDSLTTFDYGHLSPDASRFLVNKIGGRLTDSFSQTSKN